MIRSFLRKEVHVTMQFPPKVKKALDISSTVLVAIVVIFAILLVGVRLFDIQVYSVISGSMRPDYPVGCLIYVKECDPSEVEVGDVITFVLSNETPATHRVIAIDKENQCFYTRGDDNYDKEHYAATGEKIYTEDPPVYFKNLVGKPVFVIPVLGFVAHYIQHPPGMYVAIAAGAVLLILVFLPDLLKKEEKKDEKEAAPAEAETAESAE